MGGGGSVVVVVSGGGSVVTVVCTGGDVWGGDVWGGAVVRGAVVTTPAWVVAGPPAGAVVDGATVEEVEVDEAPEVVGGPVVVDGGTNVVVGVWLETGWRAAVSAPVATSNSMPASASVASAYSPTLNR